MLVRSSNTRRHQFLSFSEGGIKNDTNYLTFFLFYGWTISVVPSSSAILLLQVELTDIELKDKKKCDYSSSATVVRRRKFAVFGVACMCIAGPDANSVRM